MILEKAEVDGKRTSESVASNLPRGNGEGMQAEETRRNTGNPSGDRGSIHWHLVRARPGRAGWRRGS